MHITVGGALMLVGLMFVWIFASAVSNDPGCLNIENSVAMWGADQGSHEAFPALLVGVGGDGRRALTALRRKRNQNHPGRKGPDE